MPTVKRLLSLFLVLFTLCCLLCGCAKKTEETPPAAENPSSDGTSAGDATADSAPETPTGPTSALTGLPCAEEEANLRPVAFAVNNEIEYLPSGGLKVVGLSNADVIFETNMEANGSGTRLLPLFSQSALKETERVGSIRSARPYFINLALLADAYYCHDGASSPGDCHASDGSRLPANQYASWMLQNSGIDRISLYSCSYGGLDANLKNKIGTSDTYNTLCAFGPEILSEFLNRFPENTYDNTENRTLFSFGTNTMADALSGESVKVIFSDWNSYYTACDFVYDAESGLYEKGQYVYGNMKTRTVPTDVNNGETLNFTNVFVLFTDQYAYDYQDSNNKPYHIKVELLGKEGEGYYFSQGKYLPITWKCDNNTDSAIRYYTKDGNELIVNPGKTYVNLVDEDVKEKIEIS